MSPRAAFEAILEALERDGRAVQRRREGEARSRCPAHEGESLDSLSVKAVEGHALVHCFGGCAVPDVMAGLGLSMADLYDERGRAQYDYFDAAGTLLRSVARRHHGLEQKARYRQSGPATTGTSTLYRLPQVLEAVAAGREIYVVEGEKDVHALEALGAVATTAPQGAGNWHKVDASPLHGADVRLVPDQDLSGAKHATAVRTSLAGWVRSLVELRPVVGKDAADHVGAGHGLDDLVPVETTAAPADDAEPIRGTVVTLADVTPEHVQWLWPGRFPVGKLVVIDGDPSTGKSTLTIDVAARLTTGAAWPDGAAGGTPTDVLLMSAEDGLADTVAPRLAAAGADRTRVHALTEVRVVDDLDADAGSRMVPPSLPRDIPIIEATIRRHRVRLLVIDVLMAYLTSRANSSSDQDMRGVLHLLSAMAERTGCTVLLLRHLNKSGGSSPLYRGGGSIGIIGAARAAYIVARDPEDHDRRILAVSKLNIAVEPPALAYRLVSDDLHGCARVEWEDAPTEHTAGDLLRAPEDEEERSERDEAVEWLRGHLVDHGGEAVAGDVLKAGRREGLAERTLKRARQRAGVSTRKDGLKGGWVWTLEDRRGHEGAVEATPQEAASTAPSVAPSVVLDSAPTDDEVLTHLLDTEPSGLVTAAEALLTERLGARRLTQDEARKNLQADLAARYPARSA